jgi:hypothetical protein
MSIKIQTINSNNISHANPRRDFSEKILVLKPILNVIIIYPLYVSSTYDVGIIRLTLKLNLKFIMTQ